MLKKKKSKKELEKETLFKLRLGKDNQYEIRISLTKVEIEDVQSKMWKHVYSTASYEGGLFASIASPRNPDGTERTKEDIETNNKVLESLVLRLIYTQLIFSNSELRSGFDNLVDKAINNQKVEPSENDEEIIESMKNLDDAEKMAK